MKIPPPLLASVRVSTVLGLCWLSYQAGQAVQALKDQAADGRVSVVYVERTPPPGETGGLASGTALGERKDVITPLNVRDPSALVMAPVEALSKPSRPAPRLFPAPKGTDPDPNF